MIDLILFVGLPVLVLYCLAAHVRRAQARKLADRIIAGSGPNNITQLNKCITVLTARNAWLIGRAEQDAQRIERLRDIRKNLVRQQNGIYKNSPCGRV